MEQFRLSTQQVAEQLGLHRTTVLLLVEQGKLEARVFTYGSRPTIRISQDAVDRFLSRYADPAVDPWDPEAGRG